MKFTIYQKELKQLVEKVATVINKKAALEPLKQVHFKVETYKLTLWATDLEQFVIAQTSEITNITNAGEKAAAWSFAMHMDDIKVLTKLPDFLTLEQLDEYTLQVQSGRKKVTIPLTEEDKDITIPTVTEDAILTVKENWLLETVTGMESFTSADDSRPILQVFHFNTMENRVEVVDSYKLATRTLENQTIHSVQENPFKTVRLHNKCVPVFKKLLDKKSENTVDITRNNKYVKVSGNDFTYISRAVEGEYCKVTQMLPTSNDYTVTFEKENMMEVIKYAIDLKKTDKNDSKIKGNGIIFYYKDGKWYAYIKTPKYTSLDEMKTTENTTSKEFCIHFNPSFLVDVLNTIDTDTVVCTGMDSSLRGWVVTGKEYQFFVLPIHLGTTQEMIAEEITKYFK